MKKIVILEVPKIDGTPARCDHHNGIIYISKAHFDNLEPIHKDFILAHEEGHLVLNTKNEEVADDYAMNKLLKLGYPLSKILGSLTKVLHYDKSHHYGRTKKIFDKLFIYDYIVNNNKKLFNHLNIVNMETPIENDLYNLSYESDYSDFLGLGKKARERHQVRMDKKRAKNLIRQAKAEKELAKAKAIEEGTPIPESGTGIKNILTGVGKVASGIFGKGTTEPDEGTPIEKNISNESTKKDKTITYVIIVVLILLIIIAAYFIFFSKKTKK